MNDFLIFNAALTFVGAGAICHSYVFYREFVVKPGRFLKTIGKIIESEYIIKKTGSFQRVEYPHIKYQYSISGKTYENDAINPGLVARFESPSRTVVGNRSILKKYPLNKDVTIYYDQKDPSHSHLEPCKKSYFFIVGAIGSLVVFWAIQNMLIFL